MEYWSESLSLFLKQFCRGSDARMLLMYGLARVLYADRTSLLKTLEPLLMRGRRPNLFKGVKKSSGLGDLDQLWKVLERNCENLLGGLILTL